MAIPIDMISDSVAPLTSSRLFVGLLGFLSQDTVCTLLGSGEYQLDVPGFLSLEEVLRPYTQSASALAPLAPAAEPRPLHPLMEDRAKVLRSSSSYQLWAARIEKLRFGIVQVDDLLTPQFFADLSYVSEIEARLDEDISPELVFDYLFGTDRLADPSLTPTSATFSSRRRDLLYDGFLRTTRVEDGVIDVTMRVRTRPTFCHVTLLENGQQVLTNGIHRTLALYRKGVREIPCLLQESSDLGIGNSFMSSISSQLLTRMPRAAKVVDFANPILTTPLFVRETGLILRLAVSSDLFVAPLPR